MMWRQIPDTGMTVSQIIKILRWEKFFGQPRISGMKNMLQIAADITWKVENNSIMLAVSGLALMYCVWSDLVWGCGWLSLTR